MDKRSSIAVLLGLFVAFLAPGLASAQDRGFVVGNFGLTFAESTDVSYGLTGGFNVTPAVQIVGVYSHMNDTLTGGFADFLRTTGDIAGVQIEGKLPADYAAGGVRFVFQNRESVQVYVQGEGGVGRVTSDLRFFEGGRDITDEVGEDANVDETAGALGLAGGVRVALGRAWTGEVAFKWINILTEVETLKINRLDFGLGVRF